MDFNATLKSKKAGVLTFEADVDIKLPSYLKNANTGLYQANITILDPRGITKDQRGYIYGLFNDISEYTGYPPEIVKDFLKGEFTTEKRPDLENLSLAFNAISQYDAGEFIEFILEWCFKNEVPFRHQKYFVGSEHTRMLFLYLKHRKCFISGERGDVAHFEAVGMGRNRNKIDHSKHRFMCLRRDYHIEQHTIGLEAFCEKYKIIPIKLTPQQVKEFGIGKEITEEQYIYKKEY